MAWPYGLGAVALALWITFSDKAGRRAALVESGASVSGARTALAMPPDFESLLQNAARQAVASASGWTVLRVHVLGDRGPWTRGATLTCLSSTGFRIEEDPGATLVVQDLSPDRAECEFVLPPDRSSAVVTVRAPGVRPACQTLYDLRVDRDDWAPDEAQLVREVTLALGSEPPVCFLGGRVTVDGRPELPVDLEILLKQHPAEITPTSTYQAMFEGGDRRASLWHEDASYRAWPLNDRAYGLWATSAQTVPCWVPLKASGKESLSLDLALERGGSMLLHLQDRTSGRPLAHVPLQAELQVLTEKPARFTRGKMVYRQFDRGARTDAAGEIPLLGLASDAHLRVRVFPREALEACVLETWLEGRALQGERLLIEVDALPELGTVLGTVAPGCRTLPAADCLLERGTAPPSEAWSVVLRPIDDQDSQTTSSSVRSVAGDPDSGEWGASVPAGKYEAWVEVGGTRTSEVERLWIPASRPIVFEPEPPTDFLDLSWLEVGAGVTRRISIRTAVADSSQVVFSGQLPEHAGACALPLHGSGPRLLEYIEERVGAYRLARIVSLDAAARALDLHRLFDSRPQIALGGARTPDTGSLELMRLDDGTCLAECALVRGVGPFLPLASGRYFYRLIGQPEWAVCGVFDVPPLFEDALEVEWPGAWVARQGLGDGPLEVREIEGCSLQAVPPELRRLALPVGQSAVLIDTASSAWVGVPSPSTFSGE